MSKSTQDIVAIANSLSSEEIAQLISILGNRLDVFVGVVGRHQISSRVESACMNGPVIQVNLELAQLDDISDDRFVRKGLEAWAEKRETQS